MYSRDTDFFPIAHSLPEADIFTDKFEGFCLRRQDG